MSEHGEDSDGEVEDAIVLMPGHELVTCCVFAGAQRGYVDGPIADARFHGPTALLQLSDGGLLVSDRHRLRKISADDVQQQVSTIAGEDEGGHRDGAAAQARFGAARGFLLLPDGRVLVADCWNHRIRLLSADLLEVSTVAGDGTQGHHDGAAAQARFYCPMGLALLPDGRVLVADCWNCRIRLLSADLQEVRTVAGDGTRGHRDGAAAQARFNGPTGLALLPDGRVLVADCANHRIRLLSADLLEVSTAAGDGTQGHRDGAAAKASLHLPRNLVVLRDGRVLVLTCQGVRVLSADFQQVHAVAPRGVNLWGAVQRFDGSVVISFCGGHLCVLDGFEARLTKRRRTCVTDT